MLFFRLAMQSDEVCVRGSHGELGAEEGPSDSLVRLQVRKSKSYEG